MFYQKIKEFLAKTLVFFFNSKVFFEGCYSAEKWTYCIDKQCFGACFYLVGKWCWVCKVVIWSKCWITVCWLSYLGSLGPGTTFMLLWPRICALERGYFVVYQCFFFVKSGQTIVFMRNKYTFQSYCHVSCILLVGAGWKEV